MRIQDGPQKDRFSQTVADKYVPQPPPVLRDPQKNNSEEPSLPSANCENGLFNCAITLPNDLPMIEFDVWALRFKGSGSATFAYLTDPYSPFYISNGAWGVDNWELSPNGYSLGSESLSVNFFDNVDLNLMFGSSVEFNPTPNVSIFFQNQSTFQTSKISAEESMKVEFSFRPIELAFVYYLREVPIRFPGLGRVPLVQP
jgi:hypothetical protein